MSQLNLPWSSSGSFTDNSDAITALTTKMSLFPTSGGAVTRPDVKVAVAALLDARAAGAVGPNDNLLDPAVIAKIAPYTVKYAGEVPENAQPGQTFDKYRFTASTNGMPNPLGGIYASLGAAQGVTASSTATTGVSGTSGVPGYTPTSTYGTTPTTGTTTTPGTVPTATNPVTFAQLGLPSQMLDDGDAMTPVIDGLVSKYSSNIGSAGWSLPNAGTPAKVREEVRAIALATQEAAKDGKLDMSQPVNSASNIAAITPYIHDHLDGLDTHMFDNNATAVSSVLSALAGPVTSSSTMSSFPNTTNTKEVVGEALAQMWDANPTAADYAFMTSVLNAMLQASPKFVGNDPTSPANMALIRSQLDAQTLSSTSVAQQTKAVQALASVLNNYQAAQSYQTAAGSTITI